MISTTDIVGYAATIIGTALMLPQLVKSWRTKRTKDLSLGTLALYFLNCFLWGGYGLMLGAMPIIIANALGFFISITLLALKLKYR
jgi:MtN3 and saliva related transmembrane protein